MSKAFTSEENCEVDDAAAAREGPALPEGAKNYMTPAGAARLESELRRLRDEVLPSLTAAVAAGATGDAPKQLREATARGRFLARRREALEVVEPPLGPTEVVRFGASVTVREGAGGERTFRIVGVDEADAVAGAVSWLSPVARALLGKEPGDKVSLPAPSGERVFEVVVVAYDDPRT